MYARELGAFTTTFRGDVDSTSAALTRLPRSASALLARSLGSRISVDSANRLVRPDVCPPISLVRSMQSRMSGGLARRFAGACSPVQRRRRGGEESAGGAEDETASASTRRPRHRRGARETDASTTYSEHDAAPSGSCSTSVSARIERVLSGDAAAGRAWVPPPCTWEPAAMYVHMRRGGPGRGGAGCARPSLLSATLPSGSFVFPSSTRGHHKLRRPATAAAGEPGPLRGGAGAPHAVPRSTSATASALWKFDHTPGARVCGEMFE